MSMEELTAKTEQLNKKACRALYRATYNDRIGNTDVADLHRYRLWNICEQLAALAGGIGVIETAKMYMQFVGA